MLDNNGIIMPPQNGMQMIRKIPFGTFMLPEIGFFNPLPDITSEEVAKIVQMAISGLCPIPRGFMYDFKTYAEEQNLTRHFTQTEKREQPLEAANDGQ